MKRTKCQHSELFILVLTFVVGVFVGIFTSKFFVFTPNEALFATESPQRETKTSEPIVSTTEMEINETVLDSLGEFPSEVNAEGELKISVELCPPGIQQIPKIFHQIWIDFGTGSEPNDEHRRNAALLQATHPDWQYILWNSEGILTLIKEHTHFFLDTYQAYDKNIKKHDAARLIILYAIGGVYLDSDYITLRNIETLIGTCKFVASNQLEKPRYDVINSLVGSVPRNPFFLDALREMAKPEVSALDVHEATGPYLFARVLKEYMKRERPTGFKLYDRKFTDPYHLLDGLINRNENLTDERLQTLLPDSFFYHGYASSWRPANTL